LLWIAVVSILAYLSAGKVHGDPYLEATYDPDIPTLNEVVGHESGEGITAPDEILAYLEALRAAAPDRVRIVEYARSWQGRPLVYAVIAQPETIARLDEVKANLARLGSGEALSGEARDRLIRDTPAVTWLSFGVHGDEITPPDSGLALA